MWKVERVGHGKGETVGRKYYLLKVGEESVKWFLYFFKTVLLNKINSRKSVKAGKFALIGFWVI